MINILGEPVAPPRDTTELAVIKLACKIKQIDTHSMSLRKEKDVCSPMD